MPQTELPENQRSFGIELAGGYEKNGGVDLRVEDDGGDEDCED